MSKFGTIHSTIDRDLYELIKWETQFWCQKLSVTASDLFQASEHELVKKLIALRKSDYSTKMQKSGYNRDINIECEKPWRLPGGCDNNKELFTNILRTFAAKLEQKFHESQMESEIDGNCSGDSDFADDDFDGADDCYDEGPCASNAGAGNYGSCGASTPQWSCESPFGMPKDQYINQCMGRPSRMPAAADVIFQPPPDGCVPCWGDDNNTTDASCGCSCPPGTPKICPRVKGIEYEETFLKGKDNDKETKRSKFLGL